MNSSDIIKDGRVLTPEYLPNEMVCRNQELQEVSRNLKPILRDEYPRNMLLHGPPGTGKTTMSEYVVRQLQKHTTSVVSASVNCWRYPRRFKVYYNLLQDLGVKLIHRTGTPTDELVDKFNTKIQDKNAIVILDEVDQIEDERVLYDFARMDSAALIMIANRETALADVDKRIRSSLQGMRTVKFPGYTREELLDILKMRAKNGLYDGVVEEEVLDTIASECNGDARVAINCLRISAETAKDNNLPEIGMPTVEDVLPKAKQENKQRTLDSLNKHQEIMYEILEEEGSVQPKELYEKYEERVDEDDAVVDRTLRKYLKKMQHYNLVKKKGGGRWTEYVLV